jgi:hypothetical protein
MSRLLDVLTLVLAALLLLALAALALRGIVDPRAAALAFGLAADDPAAAFYHAVYRDRNLALAVTGLIFLVARMWRALAILASVAITLPAYDIYALMAAKLPVVPLHYISLVALVVLSALLWRLDMRVPKALPQEK